MLGDRRSVLSSSVTESQQRDPSRRRHKTHRDLIAWQAGMKLLVEAYRVARELPDVERYGLAAQLRRAAVSIPANIAEGFGRSTRGDYLRHLAIASGSLRELQTHLEAIVLLRYLPEDEISKDRRTRGVLALPPAAKPTAPLAPLAPLAPHYPRIRSGSQPRPTPERSTQVTLVRETRLEGDARKRQR